MRAGYGTWRRCSTKVDALHIFHMWCAEEGINDGHARYCEPRPIDVITMACIHCGGYGAQLMLRNAIRMVDRSNQIRMHSILGDTMHIVDQSWP